MNELHKHAMTEFRAAGWIDDAGNFKDEWQEDICQHVLELLQMFYDEGHSGTTAPYTVSLFEKLALFEPLVPLTGEDSEWCEVEKGVFQNKRYSSVFKQADRFNGQAYDLNGRVFYEWRTDPETGKKFKSHYTNKDSLVPITFPYMPTTEYVERVEE